MMGIGTPISQSSTAVRALPARDVFRPVMDTRAPFVSYPARRAGLARIRAASNTSVSGHLARVHVEGPSSGRAGAVSPARVARFGPRGFLPRGNGSDPFDRV